MVAPELADFLVDVYEHRLFGSIIDLEASGSRGSSCH